MPVTSIPTPVNMAAGGGPFVLILPDTNPTTTVPISINASGDSIIVPAQAGKRIVVMAYFLSSPSAIDLTWKSGSAAITGPLALAKEDSIADRGFLGRVFQTGINQALVLNASAKKVVGGYVSYFLE